MRRIKIFEGAAAIVDDKLEKKGTVVFTTNTKQVDEVNATSKNIKKYIEKHGYPKFKDKK